MNLNLACASNTTQETIYVCVCVCVCVCMYVIQYTYAVLYQVHFPKYLMEVVNILVLDLIQIIKM